MKNEQEKYSPWKTMEGALLLCFIASVATLIIAITTILLLW